MNAPCPLLRPALLLCLLCLPAAQAFAQSHDHRHHRQHVPVPEPAAAARERPAAHDGHADDSDAHRHHGHAVDEPAGAQDGPHAGHGHHHHGSGQAQPREPIPPVTDADRAAAFPVLRRHMEHAPERNFRVLFNRFEWQDADHGSAQAWEGSAWFGSDLNRLWLRSEGEREGGRTHSSDLELLYGRSVSPWWDVVAGVRQEFRPGPSRSWAAVGVQGLAPYMFEVSATAYVGASGRTAASLELEYELLLTNRLVLQPLLELELHGRDDPRRGLGKGLATAEAGLRLRYEVSRRFAPYVGVSSERAFGRTADLRREAGQGTRETRFVAGVRWWF